MDQKFIDTIKLRHLQATSKYSQLSFQKWTNQLYQILFPKSHKQTQSDNEDIQKKFQQLRQQLDTLIIDRQLQSQNTKAKFMSEQIFKSLPLVLEILDTDLRTKSNSEQNSTNRQDINHIYPAFFYMFHHRLAHEVYKKGYKKLASSIIKPVFGHRGLLIHQGAQIGRGVCIVNGLNIQIGETAIIGENVKVYDGVCIGSLNQQSQSNQKTHPTIENNVVLYAGATILGGQTIIGHDSIIGSTVCLKQSVLPNSRVFNQIEREITSTKAKDLFSIQSLIGNTPLVEVKNIFKNPKVKILAKLQGQNPGGSVKDRPAYNMIKQALKRGEIKPGMKLIQPTSGNTGIALAMIACVFDLNIELVMPQNSTAQRVQTMQAYGAKVVLTSAKGGIQGSRDYAQEQVAKGGYKMLNQFANPDNYMAHYHSTGPQIWRDTKGKITHFVSSMGTTGTIMGTSMYLKQKSDKIQIVGVQPTQGAKIPGIRRWTPQYLPKIFNAQRVDQIIDVSEEESLQMMRRMAKQQAIFAGMSSGGAMAAAVKLAKTLEEGIIVSIVCDRGDRYLSSGIFANEPKS